MKYVSPKKEITRSEYVQLVGLYAVAEQLQRQLDECDKAALLITQETDDDGVPLKIHDGGHTSDYIYGSRSLDDMLRILGIKVLDT